MDPQKQIFQMQKKGLEEIADSIRKDDLSKHLAPIGRFAQMIIDNVNNEPGKTPVKGEDYMTEEDMDSIVSSVMSRITIPDPVPGEPGVPGKNAVVDYAKIEKFIRKEVAGIRIPVIQSDEKIVIDYDSIVANVLKMIPDADIEPIKEYVDDRIRELQESSAHVRTFNSAGPTTRLGEMSDVSMEGATAGQVLSWNGSTWELIDAGGSDVGAFTDLTDTPSSYSGSALKVVQVNAGETALEFATLAGGGNALTSNPLSQFAATTSLQLKNTISDETGSGSLVFATSPTFVTPALGTPSALVGTNITGTGAGFTAGAVTNATLTTALTVNTGTLTLTANAANTSVLTIGAGAVSVLGTNTGDQTSVSGNAGTATALQNARTIAGVSFDGTANISLNNNAITNGAGYITSATAASTYQPLDSDLTTIAGLTATTGNIIQSVGSAWASQTPAQVTATLIAAVGDAGSGGTKGLVPAPATGDATKFLRGDMTYQAIAGGGDALTANPLSQFAATTSLQLKGVISDETGSGALVFATSPTFITPILGTPTSGTLTNATGLPLTGLVSDTTTALGIGSINLGHASDTTLARVSAGVVAIEGSNIVTEATAANARKTSIGFTIDGGGSAIATGKVKGFFTCPYAGTISAWSIVADVGTVTVKVWKIATGTAKPTSANSINTSGVALSTGTAVRSATVTDFTSTTVTANDIFAFNIEAVTSVTEMTFTLEVTKT